MLTVGSLFSGIGLLDYGLHLAGLHHAWLCEADPWRRGILAQRWPGTAVHDDVRAVGAGTACRVDVIAGGFPCKGASTAGKRNGFDHAETVLWREMARAVGELRPRYVLVENVANILGLHNGAVWAEVLGDLAACGYDITWDCLPAGAVGAPHGRDRVFAIAAHADSARGEGHGSTGGVQPQVAGTAADNAHPLADPERGGQGTGERHLRTGQPDPQGCTENAPDPDGTRGSAGRERERSRSGITGAERRDHAGPSAQAAPHAARDAEGGASPSPGAERERTRLRLGVAVEWGDYEPAIRRWEAIHGPAPEPLVRRMDARSAARVERSRLSALGDGVQVQVGQIAGAHIMSMEGIR